ncbi:MAG: ABC transporter permease subunit [Deltaproteobacteria bacterium]|nr:ABC transporter permease subunit [Deltaproteobacteria bacterium]
MKKRHNKRSPYFYCLLIVTWIILFFLIIPIIISLIGSFAEAWQKGLFGNFTLDWYRYVLKHYSHTIKLSLLIAFCCVIIQCLIGVPAAYVLVKTKSRFIALFEELIMLPIAIPGIALAIALIQTHSFIRGNWYFILIGHVVFTLPFMIRTVVSTMKAFDLDLLEEGATSLGAPFWFKFFHVVIPNVKHAIIAGALMVFTISLGEFNLTLFLMTPLNMTLPVGLYDSYASMRIEVGSAYTSLFFVILIPITIVAQYLGGKEEQVINV